LGLFSTQIVEPVGGAAYGALMAVAAAFVDLQPQPSPIQNMPSVKLAPSVQELDAGGDGGGGAQPSFVHCIWIACFCSSDGHCRTAVGGVAACGGVAGFMLFSSAAGGGDDVPLYY
jgi:hypothetical protein